MVTLFSDYKSYRILKNLSNFLYVTSKNPKLPQPFVFWGRNVFTVLGLFHWFLQYSYRQGGNRCRSGGRGASISDLPSVGTQDHDSTLFLALGPLLSLGYNLQSSCFHSLWYMLRVTEVSMKNHLVLWYSSGRSPQPLLFMTMCANVWEMRTQKNGMQTFKVPEGQGMLVHGWSQEGRTRPVMWWLKAVLFTTSLVLSVILTQRDIHSTGRENSNAEFTFLCHHS